MRNLFLTILLSIVVPAIAWADGSIVVFAGAASQPPLEEAAKTFETENGIKVTLHLGGSGAMLNQINLTRQGDLYIPGSPDYMEKAQALGVTDGSAETIAYLVPAVIVAKGNPLGIQKLEDLARPGLRIGIADPNGVCVGLYAVEILETNDMIEKVRSNLHGMVESCSKVASMIPLNMADVVLGWREFASWNPDVMEAVLLAPEETPRLATIPAAVLRHSKNKRNAERFIAFLKSASGEAIFKKWGYLTEETAAREFAPRAKIGGAFQLPEGW